jgi:uncharacterized membrane protein YfcA
MLLLVAIALVAILVAVSGRPVFGIKFDPGTTLAGLLVGALVGMTGMGSGSLMAPILILIVGVTPVTAVGTDLAYAAITKVVGGFQHTRLRTVNYRMAGLLALGSVPASLLSVQVLEYLRKAYSLDAINGVVTRALGVVLIVSALSVLFGLLRARRKRAAANPAPSRGISWWAITAVGAVVGFLVGLTSVGSGSIIVALLSLFSPLPATMIVGTDIAHAAALTSAAGLAHGFAGNVDPGLLLNLLAGSIPGVLLGSRLSVRIPVPALRTALGLVLLATGLKLV